MRSFVATAIPAIVGIALSPGCVTRTARPCDPVAPEFALPGQAVYRECGVDRKARLSSTPPRLSYTPSGSRTCYRAIIDVVIDSAGRPVPETAHVVRATDPEFGVAVLNSLPDLRYDPALKDGHPVAQLVRVDQSIVGVVRAGPAGAPPRPPSGPPPC